MTPHVLDQLPLWVEGDLDLQEHLSVEGHLAQCPECRAASEQLRASQAWLRAALDSPFSPEDRERLRRKVMAQLHAEPAPRPLGRLTSRHALLAASAATLLLALSWRLSPRPATSAVPPQILPSQPHGSVQPALSRPAAAPAWPPVPLARAAPTSYPASRAEVLDPPGAAPARIEFQTADPSIRIIWLAQAKPLPETTPSAPEAP